MPQGFPHLDFKPNCKLFLKILLCRRSISLYGRCMKAGYNQILNNSGLIYSVETSSWSLNLVLTSCCVANGTGALHKVEGMMENYSTSTALNSFMDDTWALLGVPAGTVMPNVHRNWFWAG
ncbi:hypothetical protein XENORESO_020924 [Xenotaenia resolanae]|uniref:Uncharacterized protein n=1 Tax=Xenotaenia resolanae TaxID=208358 RepID=A0ABV0W1G3_9TELE